MVHLLGSKLTFDNSQSNVSMVYVTLEVSFTPLSSSQRLRYWVSGRSSKFDGLPRLEAEMAMSK